MDIGKKADGPNTGRDNGTVSMVDHLTRLAAAKQVNHIIPLPMYYRSAGLLQRQAEEYRRTRNQEQLYLMLLRFVSLIAETIPRHTTYNKNDPNAVLLRQQAAVALEELEQLKTALQLVDAARLVDRPFLPTSVPDAVQLSAGNVPGLHWEASGTDLEGLGSKEWQERIYREHLPPTSLPKAAVITSQGSEIPSLAIGPGMSLPMASNEILSKHAILPSLFPPTQAPSVSSQARSQMAAETGSGVPSPVSEEPSVYSSLLSSMSLEGQRRALLPLPSPYAGELQLGPQELGVTTSPHPTKPIQPGHTCCSPAVAPSMISGNNSVPEVRKRQQIRDVHVSVKLMDEFLRYAEYNTRRGIETCGILAGTLSPDDACFSVTALIVPKQEGTTDTVQALAEEEIFEAQDSRALYPLGWIHTHPTQTCFLSSIDVHTQCGYQTMLDEAVAIVMAPRDSTKRVGIFRLTTPGGLSLVQRCPLRGFHAHPPTETGQELYELCGHVYLNPRVGYEVIDLRGKSWR